MDGWVRISLCLCFVCLCALMVNEITTGKISPSNHGAHTPAHMHTHTHTYAPARTHTHSHSHIHAHTNKNYFLFFLSFSNSSGHIMTWILTCKFTMAMTSRCYRELKPLIMYACVSEKQCVCVCARVCVCVCARVCVCACLQAS